MGRITRYIANDINGLLGEFLKNLHLERQRDPFGKTTIIVPNIHVKKWLQLQIAKKLGVSAGFYITFLETELVALLNEASNQKSNKEFIFLNDKDRQIDLQLFILSKLEDDFQEQVEHYIRKGENDSSLQRAWQFAEKLSYFFREYEYQRPEMIEAWKNNKSFFEMKNEEDLYYDKDMVIQAEELQKAIYKKVFIGDESMIAQYSNENREYTTLPQYASRLDMSKPMGKRKIYLFGMSQISLFHIDLLHRLQIYYDFQMYQINYNDSLDKAAYPLAQKWTKAFVINNEFIKEKFLEINNKSINKRRKEQVTFLSTIQASLQGDEIIKKMPQDTSFQIAAAPSVRREVESVYNSIIHNMQTNRNLKLSDIVVLVTNMDTYRGAIQSTFTAFPYQNREIYIPYSLSDSNAGVESMVSSALFAAFDAVNENFSRQSIVNFLVNPCVLEALEVTRETVQKWVEIIDALNVFYGYDNEDKNSNNYDTTLINDANWAKKHNTFTWSLALQRIRLGQIMREETAQHFNGVIPFSHMWLDDDEFFEKMVTSLEELFEFLAEIKSMKQNATGETWANVLTKFFLRFIKVPESMKNEGLVHAKALELFQRLIIFDEIYKNKKLDFYYISSYVRRNIGELSASRGRYLTDGITIAQLAPMKPIPFKVMYILGMGEGQFPHSSDHSTLDLRNLSNEKADISAVERDSYLFLELLSACQEKLYISYVAQDLEKDKEFYPSSLIRELVNHIEEHICEVEGPSSQLASEYVLGMKTAFKIAQVPLTMDSALYFNEEASKELGSWSDIFECYVNSYRTRRNLFNGTQESEAKNDEKTSKSVELDDELDKVSLYALKDFVEDHAKAIIKHKYGASNKRYENIAIKKAEPLEANKYTMLDLVKQYLMRFLVEGNFEKLKSELETNVRQLGLKGDYPEPGLFNNIAVDNAVQLFALYAELLPPPPLKGGTYFSTLQFDSHKTKDNGHALRLDLKINNDIEIIGQCSDIIIQEEEQKRTITYVGLYEGDSIDKLKSFTMKYRAYLESIAIALSSEKKATALQCFELTTDIGSGCSVFSIDLGVGDYDFFYKLVDDFRNDAVPYAINLEDLMNGFVFKKNPPDFKVEIYREKILAKDEDTSSDFLDTFKIPLVYHNKVLSLPDDHIMEEIFKTRYIKVHERFNESNQN